MDTTKHQQVTITPGTNGFSVTVNRKTALYVDAGTAAADIASYLNDPTSDTPFNPKPVVAPIPDAPVFNTVIRKAAQPTEPAAPVVETVPEPTVEVTPVSPPQIPIA